MSFWTQKKEPIFICLYFASHPPPFTHPPICQAEAIPSASGLLSLLTVKPQGSIWLSVSHVGTEGSRSRRVCWSAPLQSHGLAPLLPCTAQPALASPFSAHLSLLHLSFNYIPRVPSNSSCPEGNHDLSHSFILHSVTGWPCHSVENVGNTLVQTCYTASI